MGLLDNRTAAQLADAVDDLRDFPHNTAAASMVDEAAGRFVRDSDEVADARRKFGAARYTHKRSYADGRYSDTAWDALMRAGDVLADALRRLGARR